MKKLAIFDLDGTLIDTIQDLAASCNYALAACDYPRQPEHRIQGFVGNGINKLLERCLPVELQNDENVAALRIHFEEHYNENSAVKTHPYEGVVALLKQLNQQGTLVAIASNKYQAATEALVNHYFGDVAWAIVLGQREGVAIKPDPTIVHDILAETNIAAQEAIYIGDSGVDMQTAQRAGVTSVGVSWGFRPVAELEANCACHIVHSCNEILALCQ